MPSCFGTYYTFFGKRFYLCKQTQSLSRAEINFVSCPKCGAHIEADIRAINAKVKVIKRVSLEFVDYEKEILVSHEQEKYIGAIDDILDSIK